MVGSHVGLANVCQLGRFKLLDGVDVGVKPEPWVSVIIVLIVATQEPGIPEDEV